MGRRPFAGGGLAHAVADHGLEQVDLIGTITELLGLAALVEILAGSLDRQ